MRTFRPVLTALLIMIAGFVLLSRFGQSYEQLPSLLSEAHKKPLWFLLFLGLLYYLSYGWLAKTVLNIGGSQVNLKETIQAGLLGALGFQVAPFVGAAVLLYCFYRKLDVPQPTILFLVSSLAIFNFLNYFIFSFLAILILPHSFSVIFPERTVFAFLFGLLAILLVSYFLVRNRAENLIGFIRFLARPVNWFGRGFFGRRFFNPERASRVIEELVSDLNLLAEQPQKTLRALMISLFFYLVNASLLYFSFYVFGYQPNLPLLLLGLTTSSVLSLLSLFPEAPGVAEASLVTVFVGLGFPAHVSLFACLLYRLVSYWLPLPLGIFVYLDLNGFLKGFRKDKLTAVES
jgi:uncharacterized protein (TIRG00374 family)